MAMSACARGARSCVCVCARVGPCCLKLIYSMSWWVCARFAERVCECCVLMGFVIVGIFAYAMRKRMRGAGGLVGEWGWPSPCPPGNNLATSTSSTLYANRRSVILSSGNFIEVTFVGPSTSGKLFSQDDQAACHRNYKLLKNMRRRRWDYAIFNVDDTLFLPALVFPSFNLLSHLWRKSFFFRWGSNLCWKAAA